MYIKDLNLIRAFAAVAEKGSLTEAAKSLNTTQPTLTRQIQSLEEQTGLNLFSRSNKGLLLTNAGKRLVARASSIQVEVDSFYREVAGQEDAITGTIRISANEIIGTYLLPPALCKLRTLYPELEIELDINNQIASLTRRDADIAFRMAKPNQRDLVARHLLDIELGLFAHSSLLSSYGLIVELADILRIPFIGYDEDPGIINALANYGVEVSRNDFVIRTDSLIAQVQGIRNGLGFGITHKKLASKFNDVGIASNTISLPDLPLWLVCHSDIQYSTKIRTVMQFLGNWFKNSPYDQVDI